MVDRTAEFQTITEESKLKVGDVSHSRRRLLKFAAEAAAATAIAQGINKSPEKTVRSIFNKFTSNEPPIAQAKSLESTELWGIAEAKQKGSEVLSLPLPLFYEDEERITVADTESLRVLEAKELEYAEAAITHNSIDAVNLGLMLVTNRQINAALLTKRHEIRATGAEGMTILTEDQKNWVRENLMDREQDEAVVMEAYASAVDARKIALVVN